MLVVSPQESAERICFIFEDREEWLRAQGLDTSTEVTYAQRGDYIKWAMNRFLDEPGEQARDEANRRRGKTDYQIKQARRSRWNLEKQRRAGSTQVWELLSFTGRVSFELLEDALQKVADIGSASERAAHHKEKSGSATASK